jgi:hypothetical protein
MVLKHLLWQVLKCIQVKQSYHKISKFILLEIFQVIKQEYNKNIFTDICIKILYYCCAGWGYIVEFTKILTIYQIVLRFLSEIKKMNFRNVPSSITSLCLGV